MRKLASSILASCLVSVAGCSSGGGSAGNAFTSGLSTIASAATGAVHAASQGLANATGSATTQPAPVYPAAPPAPTGQAASPAQTSAPAASGLAMLTSAAQTLNAQNGSAASLTSNTKVASSLAAFNNAAQGLSQVSNASAAQGSSGSSGIAMLSGMTQALGQHSAAGSSATNSKMTMITSGLSALGGATQGMNQQNSGATGGATTQPASLLNTGLAALNGASGAMPQSGRLAALSNATAALASVSQTPAGTSDSTSGSGSQDTASILTQSVSQIAGGKGQQINGWLNKGMGFANAANNLKTFFLLSSNDEKALGQSVGVSLTNKYPAPGVDPFTKYVTLVGSAVVNTSPRPDIRYVFGVLNTSEINAFSGPGGYVFVTRGALGMMKDESELAGVLAHEISHVILQHGLNQVKLSAGEQGAMQIVQMTNGKKVNKLTGSLVNVVTSVGYTQQQEFDADKSAVDLMHAAGYDPASYQNFLQRLAAIQTSGTGTPMSTHPGAAQRVAAVAAEIQVVGGAGGATLADRFQQNIRF